LPRRGWKPGSALAGRTDDRDCTGGSSKLARFLAEWSHFTDKESRQINNLEHKPISKVLALWRHML
jgi:hypothetical protein